MNNLSSNSLNSFFVASIIALSSCGGAVNDGEKEIKTGADSNVEGENKETPCSYGFVADSSTYHWLAYKHTTRVGVAGVIDSAEVKGTQEGSGPIEVFKNAEVRLFVDAIDSKDPVRDMKIMESFFGSMVDTKVLDGKVIDITGSSDSGTGSILLKLNNQSIELPFEWTLKSQDFTLSMEVNFNDFGAQGAVEALNAVCEEKHTGADGKSILWPDILFTMKSKLSVSCE